MPAIARHVLTGADVALVGQTATIGGTWQRNATVSGGTAPANEIRVGSTGAYRTAADTQMAVLSNLSAQDVVAEALVDVRSVVFDRAGIMVRAADNDSGGYLFRLNAENNVTVGTWELWRGAAVTSLESVTANLIEPFASGQKYRLRLEAIGARVRCWVDDRLLIDYTDATPTLRAGTVGIFLGGAATPSSTTGLQIARIEAWNEPVPSPALVRQPLFFDDFRRPGVADQFGNTRLDQATWREARRGGRWANHRLNTDRWTFRQARPGGVTGISTTHDAQLVMSGPGVQIERNDYEVRARVGQPTAASSGGTIHIGIGARFNRTEFRGYVLERFVYFNQTGGTIFLRRYDGSKTAYVELGAWSVPSLPPSLDMRADTGGQEWRLVVEGTSIRAIIDGVERISVTDGTYASGQPLLYTRGQGGDNAGVLWASHFAVLPLTLPATTPSGKNSVVVKASFAVYSTTGIAHSSPGAIQRGPAFSENTEVLSTGNTNSAFQINRSGLGPKSLALASTSSARMGHIYSAVDMETADYEVQARVMQHDTSGPINNRSHIGIVARFKGPAPNGLAGYYLRAVMNTSDSWPYYQLVRINDSTGGLDTLVGGDAWNPGASFPAGVGLWLRLRVEGSTIRGYTRESAGSWVERWVVTDATYPNKGFPAIRGEGIAAARGVWLADFSARRLSGSGMHV